MREIDQDKLDTQSESLITTLGRKLQSPAASVRMAALVAVIGAGSVSGCASIERGAALGGTVGAGLGNLAANSTEGTLIGFAVGSIAGGAISWDMQRDLEQAAEDSGITLTRISDSHLELRAQSDVLFDTDESRLSNDVKSTLEQVTQVLDQGEEHIVVFEGHADQRGPASYNQQLAMDRAQSVQGFIDQVAHTQGLDPGSTVAISMGEHDPVSDNHAQNRRVDIEIITGDDAAQYLEAAQQSPFASGPGM